jgi:hypothetical protein
MMTVPPHNNPTYYDGTCISFAYVDQPYGSAHDLTAKYTTQRPLLRLQYVR